MFNILEFAPLKWQFSTLGSLLSSVLGARFLDQKTGPQVTCLETNKLATVYRPLHELKI